ncbi:MAG: universal stress protein [Thermoplasmata archaeon]
MLERILVGFDGSSHARRAGQLAVEIASRFGATLTLAVVRPERRSEVDTVLEDLVPASDDGKAFSALLDEVRERARTRGVDRVEVVYLRGDPISSLLDWLARNPQDLLVVGSRGLSRGRRLLLGSVSSGLVGEAPCPVLVVRGHREHRTS